MTDLLVAAPRSDVGHVVVSGSAGPDRLRATPADVPGDRVTAGPPAGRWLRVRADGPFVLIGPGRSTCAEYGDDPVDAPNPLVTPVSAHAVAEVVADDRLARADGRARTLSLLRFAPLTGLVTRHVVLPDPRCPDRADLPDDTRSAAEIGRPLPEPDTGTFRTRAPTGRWDERVQSYVDGQVV